MITSSDGLFMLRLLCLTGYCLLGTQVAIQDEKGVTEKENTQRILFQIYINHYETIDYLHVCNL